MRYLKIQNKGLLNIEFFLLMGVSTKSDDPTKIGEHGTGLKYALAYFLRNEIPIKLFIGRKEVEVALKPIPVKEIGDVMVAHVGGKRTAISLNYGKQWEAWQAVREIYCNALDEGITNLGFDVEEVGGEPDTTTFYIGSDKLGEVIAQWDHYFNHAEPIYDCAEFAILPPSVDNKLRIYKQGILIEESEYYDSLYNYDFKQAPLNELREYKGNKDSDIADALLRGSADAVAGYLKFYTSGKMSNAYEGKASRYIIEGTLNWWYCDHHVEIDDTWGKFVYLHPESEQVNEGEYKVPPSLLKFLEAKGYAVEETTTVSKSYGGGGYSSGEAIRIVSNTPLEHRIQHEIEYWIHSRLNQADTFTFKIGVPMKGEKKFDYIINEKLGKPIYVFSNHLAGEDDRVLQTIVSIAMKEHSGIKIYDQLKNTMIGNVGKEYVPESEAEEL